MVHSRERPPFPGALGVDGLGGRVVGLVIWVVWSPCQALMTGQKTPLHSILRPVRRPTVDQRTPRASSPGTARSGPA